MATRLGTYSLWNGTEFDTWYFRTRIDMVTETSAYKVMTAAERLAISNYLNVFNTPNKLVRLDEGGKIPLDLINADFEDYLRIDGSNSMVGDLDMDQSHIRNVGDITFDGSRDLYVNQGEVLSISETWKFNNDDNVFDVGGTPIINLADPVNATDAANKRWVETLVSQGVIIVPAVRVATTSNINLTGLQTIDGIVLQANDRVLVKNQTNKTQNGIYTVASGAWTKVTADSVERSLVTVLEGTTQRRHQYYHAPLDNVWVLYYVDDDYGVISNGGLELDSSGFKFGIKAYGVTMAMLSTAVQNKWNNYLLKSGDTMMGVLDMGGNDIEKIGRMYFVNYSSRHEPVIYSNYEGDKLSIELTSSDNNNYREFSFHYVNGLSMAERGIYNLKAGTEEHHAVNKGQLETKARVIISATTPTGQFNVGDIWIQPVA